MRRMIGLLLLLVLLVSIDAAARTSTTQTGTTQRNGFNGKSPFWQKGDTNVSLVETDHAIGSRHTHNAPSAEMIKVDAQPGRDAGGNEYAHYVYSTPKAPITPQM